MKKVLFGVLLLLVVVTGCGGLNPVNAIVGGPETKDVVVERDGAAELEVDLIFGAGNLVITGGAVDWMNGELEYNSSNFEATVGYTLRGDTGKISVKQKNKGKFWGRVFGEQKNSWDLQLANDIPIDLRVKAGASDTRLDLRGLQLSKLKVDAGVGNIEVDLSGEWLESFEAVVETGVGDTTVVLPKEVGVKVTAQTGIGDTNFDGFFSEGKNVYVNEAYGTADVVIEVKAETGIGETKFVLR